MLLAGCTKVGPDFVKPDAPVADGWTEVGELQLNATQTDHADWWEAFDDPVLDKIINEAYNQNLTLQVAGLRILEARAQLGLAIGSAWPQQQQATLGAAYSSPSDNTAGSAFLNDTWNYNTGVQIGWEIDFWGKFRRGIESADATLLASIADYDTVLVTLTADAGNLYVVIRTFEERLAIARKNVKIQERSLNIADVRFRNGATTELDVQQAKTLLFSTQATIPALESDLRQTENALSTLLGKPPGHIRQMLGGHGKIPSPPAQIAVGIPADLLRRRPDVRGAELQAAAQSALIGVAKADFYPSVALLGSIGLSATQSSNTTASGKSGIGEWFTGDSLTFTGGPSVTWNIFNYGQISNNVRTQDARLQQLLVNYQNVVLQAAREVEDSSVGFIRAQEQAGFLDESVTAALRSVDLAVIQYRDGAVDYTRVLNTQQSLILQQDQATVARGDIARNLTDLYRALGGGWQLRAGRDFVPDATKETMAERTNWGDLLTPDEEETVVPPRTLPDDSYRWPDW
ncbi:MAG: efflux transporter outer membrane subunit [Chloroflexi bacterium]|nr:MAG: efflux transporter outer membrane subunit [Chloroflexota bacterium]